MIEPVKTSKYNHPSETVIGFIVIGTKKDGAKQIYTKSSSRRAGGFGKWPIYLNESTATKKMNELIRRQENRQNWKEYNKENNQEFKLQKVKILLEYIDD